MHPGIPQLGKDATRFDRFMLPSVANQENAILRLKCLQEIPHLPPGCEA
jgi:hypothetical protein